MPAAEDDLESLDEGWEDLPDDKDDEDEADDPDAFDSGWDAPKRKKTALEKRRRKAQRRAEKQRAREAAARDKQKQKHRRGVQPSREEEDEGRVETSSTAEPDEPELPRPAKKAAAKPKAHDWTKMLVLVAVVIAIGAAAIYFTSK